MISRSRMYTSCLMSIHRDHTLCPRSRTWGFLFPLLPCRIKDIVDCKLGIGAVANGLLPHNPLPCNEISYASWIGVFSIDSYKFVHQQCGKSQGERAVNCRMAKRAVCYMDVCSPSQTFIICPLISL